ncbi:hypothetical protein ALC57_14104 [Trachymyrmex cornetzi]|uniref:Uncharacterized protein n=1 Tax=Trachymyrmex cornetzi TaxID=471704 RepID=A0A151IYS3_9HYME|nr:hypothetical protein ALC57_14104 [Trachymyrmex cornetzi]
MPNLRAVQRISSASSIWNSALLDPIQTELRSGLAEDTRTQFQSEEAKAALPYFAKGIHLLADHQYHLSNNIADAESRIADPDSLYTMRSAIALISYKEIGNDPLARRFCKGVAALKSPRPRYDFIWDPAPVIAKLITIKLALLLALRTGQRAQTLASIRLFQISTNEKLIIRCPDRTKTSAPGRYQPFLGFSRFLEHEDLCIVHLTGHYIERTKVSLPLRKRSSGHLAAFCILSGLKSPLPRYRIIIIDLQSPVLKLSRRTLIRVN